MSPKDKMGESSIRDTLRVHPAQPLRGVLGEGQAWALPGDKSLSHRAAILGSLAEGESVIDNFLRAGVTQVLIEGLTQIGVPLEFEGNRLSIQGLGLRPYIVGFDPVESHRITCGNSATTMRLLAGALAAWGMGGILDGSEGLRKRPMGRITEPLRMMGMKIEDQQGYAPLIIFPREKPLDAIDYHLPVASAQVKSCLLLAGLASREGIRITEPTLSRDHTERMLQFMGARLDRGRGRNGEYVVELQPLEEQRLSPLEIRLPGDFSSAAFLIVAALIVPGSLLVLEDVGLNDSRTGLLEVLRRMGAQIQIEKVRLEAGEPVGRLIVRASKLKGITVDGDMVVRMIDEFPIFGVAAAYATGVTIVRQARELRHKESDRIHSLCQELSRLNVNIQELEDGFIVEGGHPLSGGTVFSHHDHRLAMALSAAGLAAQDTVCIEHAGVIDESFPSFVDILKSLGVEIGE